MDRLSFGIDAGAEIVAICGLDSAGALLGEMTCEASPPVIIQHLTRLGACQSSVVGIEAGGCGTPITRKLRGAGFTLRVLETRHVRAFLKATQNKTDRNDARGIAEIVRLNAAGVPDVMLKTETIQMLRSELVLRHRLMSQRIALENAIRGTLRLNGGKLGRIMSGAHLDRAVKAEMDRLEDQGVDIAEVISPVLDLVVGMRKALEAANRRLAHKANALETCQRFMSIPGVGHICALSFYTAVGDPHRFEKPGDVGPYLGLVPKVNQSGEVVRSGRISRMGNTMTRTHLVSAAATMMKLADKDSDVRRWAMRLAERAGRGKARVALARKLATVMIAMWKSGAVFRRDDPPEAS